MGERRRTRFAIVQQLNIEWARLVEGDQGRVAEWAAVDPALSRDRDLAGILGAVRTDPDRVLAALLTQASAGDLLAGRVVLQAMLGKLVLLARPHPDLPVDDFVSAMWCRIRTYPLDRRPQRIAANLAWDTRKDVLTGLARHRSESSVGSWSDSTWDHLLRRRVDRELLDHNSRAARLDAEHVIAIARLIGVIDPPTAAVLHTVYVDGATSRAAALRHDTTPAMVRYRCSSALRRLARHAAAITEAA